MRDPTVNDPDVEAAIEQVTRLFLSLGSVMNMPDEDDDFGRYGMREWSAKRRALQSNRGRHRNHHRDFWIGLAVKWLVDRDFKPTRNRENHGKRGSESASAIVALALARLRVNVDEGAIEKVWERQRKTFAS